MAPIATRLSKEPAHLKALKDVATALITPWLSPKVKNSPLEITTTQRHFDRKNR